MLPVSYYTLRSTVARSDVEFDFAVDALLTRLRQRFPNEVAAVAVVPGAGPRQRTLRCTWLAGVEPWHDGRTDVAAAAAATSLAFDWSAKQSAA